MILRLRRTTVLFLLSVSNAAAFISQPLSFRQQTAVSMEFGEKKKIIEKRRQGEQASSSMDLPPQPVVRTLEGGTELMFQMARRNLMQQQQQQQQQASSVPRWHPQHVAPLPNPTSAAALIWKNARKAEKPAMWRYAVRLYDRLMEDNKGERVTCIHHEGALLACSKLGMWQRAIQIYKTVEEQQQQTMPTPPPKSSSSSMSSSRKRKHPLATTHYKTSKSSNAIRINDNMVMSLIRACVRGARQSKSSEPLKVVIAALEELEEKHGLPLTARHLNPVAAAYQYIGGTTMRIEAASLLNRNLVDRTTGPEAEDGLTPFNVNDLNAKDKGSYTLLVNAAVSAGDWAGAVEALRDMTESGLYPTSRHLNAWSEVSERKSKSRTTRSWKKKRDECWLESVR